MAKRPMVLKATDKPILFLRFVLIVHKCNGPEYFRGHGPQPLPCGWLHASDPNPGALPLNPPGPYSGVLQSEASAVQLLQHRADVLPAGHSRPAPLHPLSNTSDSFALNVR